MALLFFPADARADVLTATIVESGSEIARLPVPDGESWCVLWRHSVKLFEVADCYLNDGGQMVLERSHLPDFAAGLDHIPGRGRQRSDGKGGYWIDDISEPVAGNAYVLRPGSMAVDHRLSYGGRVISLSGRAERMRVLIELRPEPQ